jgi:hypothetical protein
LAPLDPAASAFPGALRVMRLGLRPAALWVRRYMAHPLQHTKDVFRAIQLTDDEQAKLETILETCRRMDRERRAHDER